MNVAVVIGKGGWFVTIIDKLVGEGKIPPKLATCVFLTEIGHIAGNMEYHVAGTIVDYVIRVGCRVV